MHLPAIPVSLRMKCPVLVWAALQHQQHMGRKRVSSEQTAEGSVSEASRGLSDHSRRRKEKALFSAVGFVPLALHSCLQRVSFWKTITLCLNSISKTRTRRQVTAQNAAFQISECQLNRRGKANPNPEQGNKCTRCNWNSFWTNQLYTK